MCRALNEDGWKLIRDALRDAQGMPGIDGAIGKDNVGHAGGDVLASIEIVGVVYGLNDCRLCDVEDVIADVSEGFQVDQVAKWLVV